MIKIAKETLLFFADRDVTYKKGIILIALV